MSSWIFLNLFECAEVSLNGHFCRQQTTDGAPDCDLNSKYTLRRGGGKHLNGFNMELRMQKVFSLNEKLNLSPVMCHHS